MASATRKDIDFSNVKEGGNFNKARIPAGDYLAVITKVEDAESKSDQVFQYLFSIKIKSRPGTVLPYYCKLQENQLWKLRNILIAAGKSVPKRKAKVDPNSIVGKEIGVTIEDTEYEGKEQSEIAGVYPAADLGDLASPSDDDDDAEEPEPEPEDEEEPEEEEPEADEDDEEEAEEEADPYADMDRTALKAELKKLDAAFQAKKSQTDDDLRALLREAAGEAPADDDEEEEEEPAPAPKPARRTKAAAAKKKPAADVSDEDLEEIDIDDI